MQHGKEVIIRDIPVAQLVDDEDGLLIVVVKPHVASEAFRHRQHIAVGFSIVTLEPLSLPSSGRAIDPEDGDLVIERAGLEGSSVVGLESTMIADEDVGVFVCDAFDSPIAYEVGGFEEIRAGALL